MKWQPIETAPKEKNSVALIYAPSDINDEGTVGEAYLAGDGNWYWAGAEYGYHDPISETNSEPTHWMPLPDPPEDKSNKVFKCYCGKTEIIGSSGCCNDPDCIPY